ncbi:DUF6146 family protein [Luteirhabdus pelagi]|uniref:DUF6146 family protein n=1 Tax=Luteirhabdus pelagi TaxID=2792783 RepID=UPI00193A8EF2|nr:DUF6146 family protein [Luteirhabdus pelagi]
MKYILILLTIALAVYSCDSSKTAMQGKNDSGVAKGDTIRIANDSLEYEIIIIEPGFNAWLVTQPPRGFYGQTYLENKNRLFVQEYNYRVRNPFRFSPQLYPQEINYELNIDYGYEVNYLLFNYFRYFMQEYNQRFPGSRQ